jgi:uncharacterized protein (TIGR03437 family)
MLAAPLCAQTFDLGTFPLQLPDGTVGVPYEFSLGFDGIDFEGVSFRCASAGGALPAGLSVSGTGGVSGTPSAAGSFRFLIRCTISASDEGVTVQVIFGLDSSLRIEAGAGGIGVSPSFLSYSFTQGGGASTQSVSVVNRGVQPLTYSSSASGGAWLSASGGGSLGPVSSGSVSVTANPAGLANGVYTGQVTISASPGSLSQSIAVSMTITSGRPSISLSQSGLSFRTLAGVGSAPDQSFLVLNGGPGSLDWTATASTLSGGAGWLTVSPASGRSDSANSSGASVRVNGASLAPGSYYGQIEVRSAGVDNSPQTVSVLLTVLPQTANPPPELTPTALIFVAREGGANPAAQSVRLTSLSNQPATFRGSSALETGADWLIFSPQTASVSAASPASVNVQTRTGSLARGIYRGELLLRFTPVQATIRVQVLFIVLPRLSSTVSMRAAEGCTPARLLPVYTLLGAGFQSTVGWPTPIEVRVVDDCGDPMTAGSVNVTFSSADPPLTLTSLRDGRWSGTWQPRVPDARQVVLTVRAQTTAPALSGTAQIGGNLAESTGTPIIAAGGIVSAASFGARTPLAPGSMVSLFGASLATGLTQASQLPLQTDLGGTRVTLAGRALPLIFTSGGQVNAVIPYDIPVNSSQQLLLRRGTAYSLPEPVVVAEAQPAVFTVDQSGRGPGIVIGVKPDGSRQFQVNATNPVSSGDILVIYCAGLGAVNPPVAAGLAAPSDPVAQTVNPVTLTVGGRPAQVVFAGLVAGLTGLYQVNAVMPDGVAAGPSVPIVLTVAGQSSPPVTIAVQ